MFDGLAGTCGGGVLGIVLPALPDDPESLWTSPSANVWNILLGLPKLSVGARSPDAVPGLVSTITPSTTFSTHFRLAIDEFAILNHHGGLSILPFTGISMFFTLFASKSTGSECSNHWTVISIKTVASSVVVIDPCAAINAQDSFEISEQFLALQDQGALARHMHLIRQNIFLHDRFLSER